MGEHSISEAAGKEFVSAMVERMREVASRLEGWARAEGGTLGEIETEALAAAKAVGKALVMGLCQLSVPQYPEPGVGCGCGKQAK